MRPKSKRVIAFSIILVALFVFRTKLPFYGLVSALPWNNFYPAVFKGSGICGRLGDYRGYWEALRTKNAAVSASKTSHRGQPDASGLVRWETPLGGLWFPASTDSKSVFFTIAQFEVDAYPGVSVHAGDVVIDGGGFVGDWAKWALRAGASRAVVVEPGAAQLECIRRNLAREIQDGRVVLYPKGLWDKEERLWLGHDADNPAADAVTEGTKGAGEYIDLTTIDKMVAELGLTRVDVLKLDIEGAEVRAIHGARETLNRFRPQLAIATEHTDNHLQNNRNVIQAVHETAPFYNFRCGYCMADVTGPVPETLYFLK
jgi:FkbM family methyltransferase